MESLESKLDRLSPEERKEIEDFVDFLLSRSGPVRTPPEIAFNPPPVLNVAPPPLSLIEPVTVEETGPARLQDPDPVDDRALPTRDEASPSSFHEIGGGAQGRITHDYRDFGQFEHNPSPAAEAVKKVRRKIIARQGQEKPSHLLDWVD
jgi:hypothetical protein